MYVPGELGIASQCGLILCIASIEYKECVVGSDAELRGVSEPEGIGSETSSGCKESLPTLVTNIEGTDFSYVRTGRKASEPLKRMRSTREHYDEPKVTADNAQQGIFFSSSGQEHNADAHVQRKEVDCFSFYRPDRAVCPVNFPVQGLRF